MLESNLHGNRIYNKFRELTSKNRPALICFIVGGYPTIAHSEQIVSSLVKAGADMIEIGIPFSDPIADGPTIQNAYNTALKNGVTPQKCLHMCANLRKKFPTLPLLIMTYSNIVYKAGLEKFIKLSRLHGVDGFILPDMAIMESDAYVKVASDHGLATIFLASPNSNKQRIEQIMNVCSGFIYVVSIFGITGTRLRYEKYTFHNIRKIKKITQGRIPIAVGFGISRPDQIVSIVESGADAVILGSSLIDRIKVAANHKLMLNDLQTFVRQLRDVCSSVQISK
ncbi:MAG: tryptophan synthase subunit alpha [Nitrososphaeraceae archaeon]|jgi:tryptophan synthase alpha chain